MATLKQHQAAMVNLLANGTAIPASAVRLAHALHDVLSHINGAENAPEAHTERRSDATTPGLNDALLAADVQAVEPKQQPLEYLLKQRDNTIRQLRESNAKLRRDKSELEDQMEAYRRAAFLAQDGCRK